MKPVVAFISIVTVCCISSVAYAGSENDSQARRNVLMRRSQSSLADQLIQPQGYQPPKHVNYDVHAIPETQPRQIYVPKRATSQSKGTPTMSGYATGQPSGAKIGSDGLSDAERERRSLQRQWLRYQQELN
jgi:hypothetical protein